MKKYLKLKPHKHKSPDYRPSAIATRNTVQIPISRMQNFRKKIPKYNQMG